MSRKSDCVICMGLKFLKRKANGLKRVRLEQFDPLKTSSHSMMKKVISLLVPDRIQVATSLGQCEVWRMYLLFNICMFCILFVGVLIFGIRAVDPRKLVHMRLLEYSKDEMFGKIKCLILVTSNLL